MKNKLHLLCLALFIGIVTATSAFCSPANSEQPDSADKSAAVLMDELGKLKGAVPTKAKIVQIIALWKQLPEEDKNALKDDIVALSCAGFLAIGDMEMFEKAKKPLADPDAFLEAAMERCEGCEGTGKDKIRCSMCNGTGKCTRCRGTGRGASESATCLSCYGTGTCSGCRNGETTVRHAACRGTGRIISREKCLRTFESHRNEAEEYLAKDETEKEKARLQKEQEAANASHGNVHGNNIDNRKKDEEQRKKKREEHMAHIARGDILREGKWVTKEQRKEEEEQRKEEEEQRKKEEEQRKREREEHIARGDILRDGKWLTKEEFAEWERKFKFPADDFCDAHTPLYKDLCAGASKAWCEVWIQKKNLKKRDISDFGHLPLSYYVDGDTSIRLIFDGELEVLTAIVCRFEAPVTLDDIEAKYRKQFGTAFSNEEINGQVDYDISGELYSGGKLYLFVRTDVLRMSDGYLQADVKSHYCCYEEVKRPGRMRLAFRELELSSVRFNAALDARKEKKEAKAEKAKREKVSKALDF